jgi:hypothetical protein
MSNVIEHLFCSECQAEFTMREGDPRTLCKRCGDLWDLVEPMSSETLRQALYAAEDELAMWCDDPYIGPLTKEDQEAYDGLCLWIKILKEEERCRQDLFCHECHFDLGYPHMNDLCADCFWEDHRRSRWDMRHQ